MGRLHARAVARRAARLGDCVLAGVLDRHANRSERIAVEFGTCALPVGAFEADAAIVAVPTAEHARVAAPLLAQGLDVLIEKPMTGDAAGARALVELARREDRVLAVGHAEWWNPVWAQALEAAGPPKRVRIVRYHPPTERGLDIDVVQDLMLHDLDCVRRRLGGPIESLEATGRAVANARLDEATAAFTLAGGVRVALAASRVHAEKRRTVEIEGRAGAVVGDLLTGGVRAPGASPSPPPASPLRFEPLDRQLDDFLSACVDRTRPVNDGEEGVATLELVDRVRAEIERGA